MSDDEQQGCNHLTAEEFTEKHGDLIAALNEEQAAYIRQLVTDAVTIAVHELSIRHVFLLDEQSGDRLSNDGAEMVADLMASQPFLDGLIEWVGEQV